MKASQSNGGFIVNQASVDASLKEIDGFQNIATENDSISCALTNLVKMVFLESGFTENQTNMDKIVGGMATHLKGSADTKGKKVNTLLDAGWKALGLDGIWAGAYISPTHPAVTKKDPDFSSLYSIHKVPTKFIRLGGYHYIMQVHGQNNYYDPRKGEYINNYYGVLGYYRQGKHTSYYTAF